MSARWNPRDQHAIDRAADELSRILSDAHARLDALTRPLFRFKSGDLDPLEVWPDDLVVRKEGTAA